MKKQINLVFIFMIINCALLEAQNPEFYIKKDTWYETLISSSEKMKEYLKQKIERRNLILGEWYSAGPFKSEKQSAFDEIFEPEKDFNLGKTYSSGALKWNKQPDWKDDNIIRFMPVDKSAMYILRKIIAEKDTTVTVYLGSDDGIKVWLNNNILMEHDIPRGCERGQEKVILSLKKGENLFVMKISNISGDFAFCFSFDEADPPVLLKKLVEKDFAEIGIADEINSENQDSIWSDFENWSINELGKKYLKAYELSCEMRCAPAARILPEFRNIREMKKMRDIYYDSKRKERIIQTPKESPAPKINGPKIFGVRPEHPFLFTIPVTGKRPLEYNAENLPAGLTLDKNTGQITGSISKKGEHNVKLKVKNELGTAERNFKIVCGDKIALTPPLGWNSWNCFACAIDDKKVISAADAMVNSGLINHGWSYINIDDCWSILPKSKDEVLGGEQRDSKGMINTNKKFPDMKSLSDYVHSKGLKIGIYSSPGKLTCAGYTSSYEYEEKDIKQFAEWGIDYLKYDWCSYWDIAPKPTLEDFKKPYFVMKKALEKVNRDIVYSLCQYGMGKVWEWGNEVNGNCWRTTGDITDTWESMSQIGFSQDGHEKFAGPGNWNDPDMLVVGKVGWGPRLHMTGLRPNEQYTHISLWALLSSPLLIGCDMTQLDDFTLNLLTNDEVLDINQDILGKPAGRIKQDGDIQIWVRDLEDGSKAVGLFNLGMKMKKTILEFKDLNFPARCYIRDVWQQKDIGVIANEFKTVVPPHGVVLIKIIKK